MARELVILWVGRHDREPWRSLCSEYRERIGRIVPIRDQRVRVRARDDARQLEMERDAILAALPDPAWTVALDSQGKARDSVELSRWLCSTRDRIPHPIVLVIGSDAGLHPDVLASAQARVSFGPITLAHELARLVLYEQLYRALAIERGIQYHRAPF